MGAEPYTSTRIVLKRRPRGAPRPEDFAREEVTLDPPGEGEVLVETLWLSIDPYMRGRLSEAPSYTEPVRLGEPIHGECVGRVLCSRDPRFVPGDLVIGMGGWQSRFVLPGARLRKVDPDLAPPSAWLGVFGMPGLTAYAALEGIARPEQGETVVVPAAAGAVGSVAGQLAKRKGCRVVGIAGGRDKCRFVTETLGFDACIDRHEADLQARLRAACPSGIDVYLELVGGDVLWAVLPLLNLHARMPVVGGIAWYNLSSLPEGPDRTPLLLRTVLIRRLRLEGMIVWDFESLRPAFEAEMSKQLAQGTIRFREQVYEGLAEAPRALIELLEGRTFGKVLVRVHA